MPMVFSDVDMRDKLTSFILKNPPEQKKNLKDKKAMRRAEKERLKEGEAADKVQKKLTKDVKKGSSSFKDGHVKTTSSKKKGNAADEDHTSPTVSQAGDKDSEEDDVQWKIDTSVEAARQRIQEQLSTVTADMVMLATVEPMKKVAKPEENSNAKDNLKKGVGPKELMALLSGSRQENVSTLYEALLDSVEKGFAKYGADSQMLLLREVEELCRKANANVVKEVPHVQKALYDVDILEVEYVVKWYEEGCSGGNKSSLIWKNAKPFVEWL
ncbi:Armadillo-type fold [Cynara cardunculus var. scolymus]|uniref:Armadillo-type fold n=1 Tax=Cynara cardunculus var. scolymus TaxID=59895 RepID=A0A118DCZ2_CYNCS|nr:Armadillo-type fold [Cynara cardunculus var. scolymus]